jgi:hypothetical protein
LDYFESGDKIDITIEIEVPNIDSLYTNLTIIITGQNLISDEIFSVNTQITINFLNRTLWDYLLDYIMFIIIGLIGLVWFLAYIFSKKINKKIEAPLKESAPRRPRKGKYVKVSELKPRPTKVKEKAEVPKKKGAPAKAPEKKEKKEIDLREVKKRTDLDSLIEKDLDKKKKK